MNCRQNSRDEKWNFALQVLIVSKEDFLILVHSIETSSLAPLRATSSPVFQLLLSTLRVNTIARYPRIWGGLRNARYNGAIITRAGWLFFELDRKEEWRRTRKKKKKNCAALTSKHLYLKTIQSSSKVLHWLTSYFVTCSNTPSIWIVVYQFLSHNWMHKMSIGRSTRLVSKCIQIHVLAAGSAHICFQSFKRFVRSLYTASRVCVEHVNLYTFTDSSHWIDFSDKCVLLPVRARIRLQKHQA